MFLNDSIKNVYRWYRERNKHTHKQKQHTSCLNRIRLRQNKGNRIHSLSHFTQAKDNQKQSSNNNKKTNVENQCYGYEKASTREKKNQEEKETIHKMI